MGASMYSSGVINPRGPMSSSYEYKNCKLKIFDKIAKTLDI
jgi:hypothetical protein